MTAEGAVGNRHYSACRSEVEGREHLAGSDTWEVEDRCMVHDKEDFAGCRKAYIDGSCFLAVRTE